MANADPQRMAESPWHNAEFPSELAQIAPVLARILLDVQAGGADERVAFAVRLAMDEALANAVKHGNKLDASKTARVSWRVADGVFEAVVRDEGSGFDPQDVPDPTLPENLDKTSGRGVMLMKHYMDHVSFNDAGNQVTLRKRVAPA